MCSTRMLTVKSIFTVSHQNCRSWRKSFTVSLHCEEHKDWSKGRRKPKRNMWNMYYNLTTTVNYTWHRVQTLSHMYSMSAKRSCGSSQGTDLISKLSSFVFELWLHADKQVHNSFGLRLKRGEKPLKKRTQLICPAWKNSWKAEKQWNGSNNCNCWII